MKKSWISWLLGIACLGAFISWWHIPDSKAIQHLESYAPDCRVHGIKLSLCGNLMESDIQVVPGRSTSFNRIQSPEFEEWVCAACVAGMPADASAQSLATYSAPVLSFVGKFCSVHDEPLFPVLVATDWQEPFGLASELATLHFPNRAMAESSELVQSVPGAPYAWCSSCEGCDEAYEQLMVDALGGGSAISVEPVRLATAHETVQLFEALARENGQANWSLRALHPGAPTWGLAERTLSDELDWVMLEFDFDESSRGKWNATVDAAEARRELLRVGAAKGIDSVVWMPLHIVVMSELAYGVVASVDGAGTTTTTLRAWRRDPAGWKLAGGALMETIIE